MLMYMLCIMHNTQHSTPDSSDGLRLLQLSDDIQWLSDSKPLMKMPSWLSEFKFQTTPDSPDIPTYIDWKGSHRLGFYFEYLVEQYLRFNEQPIDINRNIAIRESKRTIGELDFLLQQDGHNRHLEVAVKYYLCTGDGTQLSDYIGPGKRDRLDIKWSRLVTHQCRLANKDVSRSTLAELGFPQPIAPQLLLTGYLFYHKGVQPDKQPKDISEHHLHGWWVRAIEAEEFLTTDCRYQILPKLHWLSGTGVSPINRDELLDSCSHFGAPKLIRLLGGNKELSRGFIVPDDW